MMSQFHVSSPAGDLSVVDHGGPGPDVLFVHAIGLCLLTWESLIARLESDVHAYTFDFPGHGLSTAEVDNVEGFMRSIVDVTTALDLHRPLLVAHGSSTRMALGAAVLAPELFGGVVLIGGSVLMSAEASDEESDFYADPATLNEFQRRFGLGRTGASQADIEILADELQTSAFHDWVMVGLQHDMRPSIYRSIRWHPNGTWTRLPTLATMRAATQVPDGSRVHPDEELYTRLTVPLWIVQEARATERRIAQREHLLASTSDDVHLTVLDAGLWSHLSHPAAVTQVIRAAVRGEAAPADILDMESRTSPPHLRPGAPTPGSHDDASLRPPTAAM